MRRWMDHHKSIPENYESDQSISEDEDCEGNVHGGWSISFGETTETKGRGQVLSQLEILTDARGLEHVIGPSNTPQKRDKLFCIQDEVDDKRQLTCLADRVSTCTSDEENISDEEVIKENNMLLLRSISSGCGNFQKVNLPVSGIARNDEECAWSAVNREVEELVHVNENAICSSSPAISSKLSKSGYGSSSVYGYLDYVAALPAILLKVVEVKLSLSSLSICSHIIMPTLILPCQCLKHPNQLNP